MRILERQKNKLELIDKLFKIHNNLNFIGNLKTEIPEQLMTFKYLTPTDCVLELGGSCRNSCVINYVLENKKNHVVIEPAKKELDILKKNRDNNNLEFQIENSAISNKPLFSLGWHTYDKKIPGSVPVNTITFNQIKLKYKLAFTTLIIDNEGNFVDMLKAFPNIIKNIRLIVIEHDFNSFDDLNYFNNTLTENNFKLVDKMLKNDEYCPGDNWRHGLVGDPIFVSVWKRQ